MGMMDNSEEVYNDLVTSTHVRLKGIGAVLKVTGTPSTDAGTGSSSPSTSKYFLSGDASPEQLAAMTGEFIEGGVSWLLTRAEIQRAYPHEKPPTMWRYLGCSQCDGTWCAPGPKDMTCPSCRPSGRNNKDKKPRRLEVIHSPGRRFRP